jgi:NDP-sugar pyrophosphorylase family protein
MKVPRVNYQWDGDLMDLSNIKEHNNNVTFVLVVIDVFNRYNYIRHLKSKKKQKTTDVLVASKSILNESEIFREIYRTDRGQEFVNKTFQNIF